MLAPSTTACVRSIVIAPPSWNAPQVSAAFGLRGSVREARRAFRRLHTRAFWSFAPEYRVTEQDLPWVVERLMTFGGREGWEIGARLCR